jgi:DNA (cytosine-5)-methyltransferase 1
MKKIRIAELFAGVGGFRLGLEKASNKKVKYEVVWSSQWEPGASTQHASDIYVHKFGEKGHSCEDIQKVVGDKINEIEDHDLLVGGFPCQDYSVARTLSHAEGLVGKKGVLWWSIYNILKKKGKNAPRFLMLENVDRLLKSPSSQRGRDFAVMLSSLASLGYIAEWRVINAAEYGFPQRRRRTYIMAYKKGTDIHDQIEKLDDPVDWILKKGVIAKAFPVVGDAKDVKEVVVGKDTIQVSEKFSLDKPTHSPFENSGIMINGKVYTTRVEPKYDGEHTVLGDIIEKDEKKIPAEFFINEKDLSKWKKQKGAKNEERTTTTGHTYHYSEGAMAFPDSLDKASRTIVTGEGGNGPSRFKHVIKTKSGKYRRLMPIELERLNMFPEDHTKIMKNGKVTSDTKRAFIMGNALVVGVIEGLGKSLVKFVEDEK